MLDFVPIMHTKTWTRHRVVLSAGGFHPFLPAILLLLGGSLGFGCSKQEEEVPPVTIQTVEAYGIRLDETATPKQVAYVLLRSLADDVFASQAFQRDQQRQALEQTFALAAYSEIERRLLQAYGANAKWEEGQRDRELFRVVNCWAPIVAHYVASFDTDFEAASRKMQVAIEAGEKRADVSYPVCHDPSIEDPAKREAVILRIELSREEADGKLYWRVGRVVYGGLAGGTHTRPASQPSSDAKN